MPKFDFSVLLGLIQRVTKNPTFQQAATDAVSGIGKQILDKLNAPEELHKLGQELVKGAPAVVGAIVKGTDAEHLVDKAIVHDAPGGAG